MQMRKEYIGLNWTTTLQQLESELAYAAARINNERVVTAVDFHTGGVATVTDGSWSRAGHASTYTPEFDAETFYVAHIKGRLNKELIRACMQKLVRRATLFRVSLLIQ